MGEQLGNYDILSELGRGGMGIVYKATDLKLGRAVAIKELLISNSLPEVERKDTVERFRREAMAAARLSHPNIVTVYDYGQDGDRHYMAMELLEGKSLGDYLDKKIRFSLQQVVDVGTQICSALDYAHQAGVVHRDIKPDNIMLAENGTVKLTDFGVARVKSDLPSMTTTGTTLGTIAYISPEQLCDSRLVDGRADIFSMGALIYEMLTFKTPFDAGNLGGTIINIMNSPPAPMREANPQIPEKLEAVILKALKKNPEERYARAAELGHALQAALRDAEKPVPRIVEARPASPEAIACRHCSYPIPYGMRVCPSCGRSGTAPLTLSISTPSAVPASSSGPPTMPVMPPRPVASAPPRMPAPSTPAASTATIPATPPRMPPPNTGAPRPAAMPAMPSGRGNVPGVLPAPARQGSDMASAMHQGVVGMRVVSSFGSPGVGHAEFQQPRGIIVEPAKHHLYVADTENGRIQVFDQSGHFVRAIKSNQSQETFRFPRALALNPMSILYVTDDLDFRIYKLDLLGRQLAVWKRPRTLDENPSIPGRLIVGPNGNLYLSEPNNNRVLVYDANEKLLGAFTKEHGLKYPGGLALDHQGNLLVLDFGTSSVHVFDPKGDSVRTFGQRGGGPAEFAVPRDLAVDRFGNVFVADTLNHRLQIFNGQGQHLLSFGKKGAGPGDFNGPESLAIGADDRMYVTDCGNGRVQVLTILRK